MTSNNKRIKTCKTVEGKTHVYDNGFVESSINENAYIDTFYLIEGKKKLNKLFSGKLFILLEAAGFFRISKEAKELSASNEYSDYIGAVAIVINHVSSSPVIEAYQKINKPSVPTKVFTHREPAIEWISEMMKIKS